MHIFEFYLCHRIVYGITVILIPNMFISYKTQAQKLNDKIWKKMIHQKQKKKRLPATGLEPGTFCILTSAFDH